MSSTLSRWTDVDTGLVHLALTAGRITCVYCTWHRHVPGFELTTTGVPTCLWCIVRACKFRRRYSANAVAP